MSSRYNEFRLDLIEDHTSLASAEAHASKLRAELLTAPGLRRTYAEEELRATEDHIIDIKRQMAMEEREGA